MSFDNTKSTDHLVAQPLFMMMIGLPHSGKTAIAHEIRKQERRHTVIVSAKVIRNKLRHTTAKSIFQEARKEIIAHLRQGHNVILDATNIDAGARKTTTEQAKEFTDKIIGIFVDTPLPVCIENYKRSHSHSYSKTQAERIKRMDKQLKKGRNKPCQAGPHSGFAEIRHYIWESGRFTIKILHPPICTRPPHKKGGGEKTKDHYLEHIAS